MAISIKNKKNFSGGYYIGRGSPLGNVYSYKSSNHPQVKYKVNSLDECISGFKSYLYQEIKNRDPLICNAVNDLIIKNLRGEDIDLVCYCSPNPCHGDVIKEFVLSQKYCINWFSNMARIPLFDYQGVSFYSVENFYQAMKTELFDTFKMVSKLSPGDSKKWSRTITPRPDWNDIKIDVMKFALLKKFSNEEWMNRLQKHRGEIIEWNNWDDTFWGKCIYSKIGHNHLGRLLSDIKKSY